MISDLFSDYLHPRQCFQKSRPHRLTWGRDSTVLVDSFTSISIFFAQRISSWLKSREEEIAEGRFVFLVSGQRTRERFSNVSTVASFILQRKELHHEDAGHEEAADLVE